MPEQSNTEAHPESPFRRDEDFTALYANNIQLEASAWDLKLLFGLLDQSSGKAVIDQHTSISIPWAQAKLLVYFLELQLAAYESDYGPIPIHPSIKPARPDVAQIEKQNPLAKALVEYFLHRYRWYFGETVPEPATNQPAPQSNELETT